MGLFEGIGGFSLAARWAGWNTPVMVEWNTYCQSVLKKNFPDATIFGDIHKFDGRPYAGQIDIITGGFPCQPFSSAGKRAGTDDDRYLWPEMLRVIREVAPAWIVGENVAGLLSMDGGRVFAGILADLENAGYSTETYTIPAIGLGAPHRRDRVWIVAHSESINDRREAGIVCGKDGRPIRGLLSESCGSNSRTTPDRNERIGPQGRGTQNDRREKYKQKNGNVLRDRTTASHWGEHWHEVATRICRVDDGVPAWLDGIGDVPAKTKTKAGKSHRLEALGNAIVWQIAYQFFDAINKFECTTPST